MLKNKKGIALIETVPLLLIFVIVFTFMLGFYGVIHTGTLMSIAAYRHSFHLFNYRSHLKYHVDFYRLWIDEETKAYEFIYPNHRYHYVTSNPSKSQSDWLPEGRGLSARGRYYRFGQKSRRISSVSSEDFQEIHQKVYEAPFRGPIVKESKIDYLSEVWLKVGYGICVRITERGACKPLEK